MLSLAGADVEQEDTTQSGDARRYLDRKPKARSRFAGGSASLRKIPTLFENLYEIVVAAATRARQINAGSPSAINGEEERPLNIALKEIAAGKTKYELSVEEETDE